MDKIFREKLENFSEEPPAFVWDNIQANLSGQKRRKRQAWYSWSAVAALLLLAFIAGWYFNESSDRVIPQVAKTEQVIPVENNNAEEKITSVTEKENTETEQESLKNDIFLADANRKETTPQWPEESKFDSETEEENVSGIEIPDGNETVTLAGLSIIPPKETADIEWEEGEPNLMQKEKIRVESAKGIFSWEQRVIHENAQHFSSAAKENRGWKLGMNVSPGYSSYSAKHGSVYASNMTYEANEGNANLSGGLSVQYKTGKRISIESGVYYAQNGQQTGSSPQFYGNRSQMDYAFAPADKNYFNTAVSLSGSQMAMNSTAGIIEFKGLPKGAEIAANLESAGMYGNSLLTSGELSQVFDFVEIPLYLRFLLIDRKMDVELVGGVNAGLVVGNNAFIDNEFGVQNIGKTRDISPVNVSGTVGVGLSYVLGKNLSVAVEPRINYYLNSINRNPEVDFRPYRIGVYTGLYYEF
ncbi:MAG: outer membrane beta-barrel protein [Mariniphaga sp.]|nr:outer membrane beta-barrel protein [Mariniphaga sp.]